VEVTVADPPPRAVTIADIAAEAGVSVPTVSRVLNGRSDVAPRTRERVEQLLREHGYRRRGVRPQTGLRLVELVFNDLDGPWALEIIRGVEATARAAGVGTVVSTIARRAGEARSWLDAVRSRESDGAILVTGGVDPDLHAELHRLHVPAVVVDPAGRPALDVPTIGAANWAGGLSATRHLIGLGHRRIGFVEGEPAVLCSRARLDGHRAALESAGLPVDPDLVVPGDFGHESGLRGTAALLDVPDPPTAVFAANDQMALGAYEAARRRGLRVPEDLSVVGFDDLPGSRWASPPLTTVHQPLAQMGVLATRTVLRMARGETIESPSLELATDLVVRDSTAPPAG
jgi:LacI family transcriptional regulator